MNNDFFKKLAEGLIDTFNRAGQLSIDLFNRGLKITIKDDNSPVSNADLKVDELITNKIKELTPDIPIISEETVDLKIKNKNKTFWLIDPIDGTKEFIAGKEEYTLNAALVVNQVPIVGLVGVPRKKRLFYTFGKDQSFLIEKSEKIKLNCRKKKDRKEVIAVASVRNPSEMILQKLREFNVKKIVKMSSSYKFCVIASGEYDIYAARERANEWDYAAGHAVAANAGALITTLDKKPFLYGKDDYKNPSLLIRRSSNLDD